MVSQAVLNQWKQDESTPFEGWDFAHIAGRLSEDQPPWGYADEAAHLLKHAKSVLDVDTGGGEFLRSLAPLPPDSWASESYPPNVGTARTRLSPLGVKVAEVGVGKDWPFADGQFDLIMNRHGHLNVGELARCLARGGTFFTQQVSSDNLRDLAELFGADSGTPDNRLPGVYDALEAHGLQLRRAETWQGCQTFADVGALIYFLKAVPWVVADFGVETHRPILEALQAKADGGEPLRFRIERFLIEAHRPNR